MSQTTAAESDSNNCWEGGKAVMDKFRKDYHNRAEHMDSFGLAIRRLSQYVYKLGNAVKKLTNDGDVPKMPKVCLPREYTGHPDKEEPYMDALVMDALRHELPKIMERLNYDGVCNTTMDASYANQLR